MEGIVEIENLTLKISCQLVWLVGYKNPRKIALQKAKRDSSKACFSKARGVHGGRQGIGCALIVQECIDSRKMVGIPGIVCKISIEKRLMIMLIWKHKCL